jgi:hypothetical protein
MLVLTYFGAVWKNNFLDITSFEEQDFKCGRSLLRCEIAQDDLVDPA